MNETSLPFDDLFRTDTRHAARTFNRGFRWDFDEEDLNESARALFRHLDKIFNILKARDYVFLSSIELDAEAGRFPELMVQYFRDEAWADTQSFFVAPIKRTGRGSEYAVGRLTFEAAPGQTVRVLTQNGGFRWGAGLRVWGLQVSEARVADAIEMSPDDAEQVRRAEMVARAAWLADIDLNSLALWLSSEVDDDSRAKLGNLMTA
jgi:hypothetical protein